MTVVLVMGVSGCGKTTVGRAVAGRLGWRFQEGDALHPTENVVKMTRGMPLTDHDRAPWLAAIAAVMRGWHRDRVSGVVTCSALKLAYRERLMRGLTGARLVYLAGDQPMIAARLAARIGHFMPPGLLASQFATLQPPGPQEHAMTIDINQSPDAIVADLVMALS